MKNSNLSKSLLIWYDSNKRDLPWRSTKATPYNVWLSEVMLQQTTVVTVIPRYTSFLERWPDVRALAGASIDDVLHEWQGLGYYARARNLHRCARVVVEQYGGVFPDDEAALKTLPGIGDYTAAAIVAIAFGNFSTPVDGNIIRVISRLEGLEQVMPAGKGAVRMRMAELVPAKRPGDFVQGLMDLGSMVCTVRKPDCPACPWGSTRGSTRGSARAGPCRARAGGKPQSYPRKAAKKPRPTRYGVIFWLVDQAGRVMTRRRDETGLLGGMMEFPSTPWREQDWTHEDVLSNVPVAGAGLDWQDVPGTVRHTFTHFHLELRILKGHLSSMPETAHDHAIWSVPHDFVDLALPTVMKKVAKLVYSS